MKLAIFDHTCVINIIPKIYNVLIYIYIIFIKYILYDLLFLELHLNILIIVLLYCIYSV